MGQRAAELDGVVTWILVVDLGGTNVKVGGTGRQAGQNQTGMTCVRENLAALDPKPQGVGV